MPATTITAAQQTNAINAAAAKYGIPIGILNGVYGMETTYGQNISTSSAGAQGAFQFLPSTARSYNYPLTNTPTLAQFQQQADAAAHYLSVLFKAHGGNLQGGSNFQSAWNAALEAYSGGGYGYSQVNAKSGHGPLQSIVNPPSLVSQAANAVSGAVSGVGNIAQLLTSTTFWLRIGGGIAALLLLYLGLHALTGQSSSPGQQAAHVKHVFVPV